MLWRRADGVFTQPSYMCAASIQYFQHIPLSRADISTMHLSGGIKLPSLGVLSCSLSILAMFHYISFIAKGNLAVVDRRIPNRNHCGCFCGRLTAVLMQDGTAFGTQHFLRRLQLYRRTALRSPINALEPQGGGLAGNARIFPLSI
jgi:hypothetical protein